MRTEIFDVEVYIDYFLVAFRCVDTQRVTTFEQWPGRPLDVKALRKHMASRRLVSFNGIRFDAPLIALAITGETWTPSVEGSPSVRYPSCSELKTAANAIIHSNLQPWQFTDRFPCAIPDWDHIDLFDVAPGMSSLKIYAGRLHSVKLQDLPIEHDSSISPEQREILRDYCVNGDTVATLGLWKRLLPQIQLREQMTEQYGIDLRSKSDAQIAEAVIKKEVGKILGKKVERPVLPPGHSFRYTPPVWVTFDHPALRQALQTVSTEDFVVAAGGNVLMPKAISSMKIKLGGSTYQMGIGGLHSTESCVAHLADEHTLLIDRDVASYYPAIILGCGLYPQHLGPAFLKVYRTIVQRRLDAKHAGDKVTADALKITINGSFGKLGSMWSALYSPDLLIQTTITGQLCLLMLIEALEQAGVPVVSANTDGVVMKCPVHLQGAMDAAVRTWEQCTGFETEATHYAALYSRDVNNYIALKPGGAWKAKGVFSPAGLAKNPTAEICAEAARLYLVDGTPVEDTVHGCQDVRKFVVLRQVKGGGVDQAGTFLGRALRWYYSTEVVGTLRYKTNGYTVARSESARPLMNLTDTVPADLDREWYVREAGEILSSVGAVWV